MHTHTHLCKLTIFDVTKGTHALYGAFLRSVFKVTLRVWMRYEEPKTGMTLYLEYNLYLNVKSCLFCRNFQPAGGH